MLWKGNPPPVRSEKKKLVTIEDMAVAIGNKARFGADYVEGFALEMLKAQYRAGLEAVEKAAKNTCVSGLGPKCNHVEHRVGREIMWAIREMKQKGDTNGR
jgi:hypothetical protein